MKQIIKQLYIYVGLTFLCLFMTNNVVKAQEIDNDIMITDSLVESVEISLLTCQPHDQIYSLYGHTAIRVEDKTRNIDYVANWGVFDSRKPNFILNFVLGHTDYMMAIVPTGLFFDEYRYYGSAVYQQRIHLTPQEKKSVIIALNENYRPENRIYRYNFFFDNCTTRARDLILAAIAGKVEYEDTEMQRGERSFRELIHWKNEGHDWAAEGNDMLLGVGADRNASHAERQFLPEILQADFDKAKILRNNGSKAMLVDNATWVVSAGTPMFETDAEFPLSPTVCFSLVLTVILILTAAEIKLWKRKVEIIDNILFFLYALPGFIIATMLFSEHPTVKVNLQILLFCPIYILFAIRAFRWKYKYHFALALTILFFIGNVLQSYASGMNILALTLLVRILRNLLHPKADKHLS